MAGPKSKIVRGAINELYELLNPERFKGDASPYPEQDWDKADGWRELVKQKKLSEKGALSNIEEDAVDAGKRKFMKGAGTLGALGLIGLKGAPQILEKVIPAVKEALPELPKNVFDLPSFIDAAKYAKNWLFQEHSDLLMNDAENLGEVQDAVYEAVENSGKGFDYFGINPNKIEFGDATNEKLLEETNIADSFVDVDPENLLEIDSDLIKQYLNDEIPLVDLSDTEGGGVGYEVITELVQKYKLTKPQIRKYLEENGVLDGSKK